MKSMKTIGAILTGFLFVLFILTGPGGIAAEKPPIVDSAIKGYDTVAYFKDGKALKGSESFTFQWHDMTWHFLSEENRGLFAASPEKYAPQYDGYCAWAMTEARKAHTDPELWMIVDGKLYLNCNKAAYENWIRDIPGNIKKADTNWIKFYGGN
jgi:hypothetical protein